MSALGRSQTVDDILDKNGSPLLAMTASAHESPSGVSSIEVFFDLVFVFVITQITQLSCGLSG